MKTAACKSIDRERRILERFVEVYCRENHPQRRDPTVREGSDRRDPTVREGSDRRDPTVREGADRSSPTVKEGQEQRITANPELRTPNSEPLCADCTELLNYARMRLERCPYDPKPKCKDCPTHCYRPEYRDRIRAVMKFSGLYFVKRGRIDWMIKYFM